MTSDICDVSPGDLTPEMCVKAPELMSAWAQNPYVSHAPLKKKRINHHNNNKNVYPHHGRECAMAAEQLLKRLVDERRAGNENAIATTDAYNACLDIWARSGEGVFAAQRAEQILIGMQDLYSGGDTNVQPNTQTFHAVILAWAKAGNRDESFMHRANQVLEWMVHLNRTGDNHLALPDEECFNTVLHGWASSSHPDAPHKTEDLLMLMNQLYSDGLTSSRPTTVQFNQVLSAWSRSTSDTAAQRSQDILNHMERIQNTESDKDLEPDSMTYSIVCATWAKSGLPDAVYKADALLKKIEQQAAYMDDPQLYPDNITYNIVIDAWAKDGSKTAFKNARALLDRQIDLYDNKGIKKCRPDVYGFTSVIASCASIKSSWKDKSTAFDVALATFNDLDQLSYDSPNHVTYGTILKACSKLLQAGSKQRRQNVRKIFRKCCEDGCAGYMVFSRLKQAASPKEYKQLVGEYEKYYTQW
eukprot:CAMPEP_0197829194 /NCGR_PEP_ID=MMETSP1437-20131217/5639_1 /TAXON_ID=49252 ORGANISM="Eucampia antarctica, Strain CCMP1452" /NCGR_SAMPLE_ID=MMETSP1437 /ASSEMBLY_ACC=CAM_ASM_001096 /LENGTH=471 /DNA_ID=CAMNT_0043430729 /DNA_START=223 /DNA_END=1635 /DNA_ORIENTATION=+